MSDPHASPAPGVPTELVVLLDATASALSGVDRRQDGRGVTWSIGGQPIAIVEGTMASFRIGREIGAAARNTPDASASALGPDWVALQPESLDDHARDRAVAWFAAAHRRAGRG